MRRVVRRIRRSAGGVNLVADVNAVVVTGSGGIVEASQHVRVTQSGGRALDDVTVEAHGDAAT